MDLNNLETPCYIINNSDYENNITQLMKAYESRWGKNVIYGYSVKTNHYPYMLKKAMEYGWRAEVVSPDEYNFAKLCGCAEENIIYNGPQKRDTVLNAVRNGAMVNLDNLEEIRLVCSKLNDDEKKKAHIGVRVNYNLEAECPNETTCRDVVGRFGISLENGDLEKAINILRKAGIRISGIHMHQSSSSRSLRIFESIAERALYVIEKFGLDDIEYVDMGGGYFGGNFFPGKPDVNQYAETICGILKEKLDSQKVTLVLEPGAAVLATSMDYLVSVLNIRDIRGERVVTVDGSAVHINPFMNPHPTPFTIINPGEKTNISQIIGGSTCMEMDRLYPRNLENLVMHDTRLLFHCCGAYMSAHNSSFINAAPNIYIKDNNGYRIMRKRNPEQMMEY